MGNETKMAKNIKNFLCHKYTGQKLRTIRERFGIGDSAFSQVCKRFGTKIEQDRQLKKRIRKLEKTIKVSNVDLTLLFANQGFSPN
jgi:hypothetical protein